jgi:hypothetical protein
MSLLKLRSLELAETIDFLLCVFSFLLLGICFLSEVVESIMRGGDRGLRGKEGLKRVDIGKWASVWQGENRRKRKIFED